MPLVTVEQDRRGDVSIFFKSERLRCRIRRHRNRAYSGVFLQGDAAAEFLASLNPDARRDVEGWGSRVVRMSHEEVAALVGGDFLTDGGAR